MNQHQLDALTKYVRGMSEEERTKDLRHFLEKELTHTNQKHSTFSDKTVQNMDRIDLSKKQLHDNVNRIDKDLSEYKNYCDAMKNDKLLKMFKATSEDMLNDN